MNAAPPGVPPVIAGAKPRRAGWIVAAVVVLFLALAVARSYHPFPSDEERQYFGWWYGWEKLDDNAARAWVAEFRDDGTLHIAFGQYARVNAEKDWVFSSTEEVGTWRVRNGVQHLVSDDPHYKVTWPERVQRWLETGYSHRRHSYRTTLINDRELHYTSIDFGTEYQSLHSRTPVELPQQPAPPEQWPMKRLKNSAKRAGD